MSRANSFISLEELNKIENILHRRWNIIDPEPDIYNLFKRFNAEFFHNKLNEVELEWTKSMYNACYHCKVLGKICCIIRLSEPILKNATRKELMEALLHEMTYAYFFVHGITELNENHAISFKRKIQGIDRKIGTSIIENVIKRPLTERPQIAVRTTENLEIPQLLAVKEEPNRSIRQEIVQEYEEIFIQSVKIEPKQEPIEELEPTCICPLCEQVFEINQINHHLDECLSLQYLKELT